MQRTLLGPQRFGIPGYKIKSDNNKRNDANKSKQPTNIAFINVCECFY